jgi:hypothetical protein
MQIHLFAAKNAVTSASVLVSLVFSRRNSFQDGKSGQECRNLEEILPKR